MGLLLAWCLASALWAPQPDIVLRRAGLEVVQDTAMGAMEALSPCRPKDVLTPPARLKAAQARLEAMREAITTVNDAVDDFEVDLSDEQKTQFEGLGPRKRGV